MANGADRVSPEAAAQAANMGPMARRAEHKEPYRTMAVVSVAVGLLVVPSVALLGHRRLAVLTLAAGVLALALVRLRRPGGTWIAARSRRFDVVFGVALAVALFLLSNFSNLPRPL